MPALDKSFVLDLGKNLKGKVEGGFLYIAVDLSKTLGKSKSGKNTLIASTGGNLGISAGDAGTVKLGLNLYK